MQSFKFGCEDSFCCWGLMHDFGKFPCAVIAGWIFFVEVCCIVACLVGAITL